MSRVSTSSRCATSHERSRRATYASSTCASMGASPACASAWPTVGVTRLPRAYGPRRAGRCLSCTRAPCGREYVHGAAVVDGIGLALHADFLQHALRLRVLGPRKADDARKLERRE